MRAALRRAFAACGLVIAPCLAPHPAGAQLPHHAVTAPATAIIEQAPDGSWKIATRATRFQFYQAIPDLLRGATFPPRLASITQLQTIEGDEASARITVAIDDVSGPVLRRVAEFSDPGGGGALLRGLYFVTTEPGCCALPARHHVRALESGRLLFSATGGGEAGAAAWMEIPNSAPTVERWAAFEGAVGSTGSARDASKIGDLRYGDRRGLLSHAVLRLKPAAVPAPDVANELVLDMATCAFLLWTEPGKPRGPGRPTRPPLQSCRGNTPFPDSLFSLEHATQPDGVALELSVSGEVYATIPVSADRLDLARATLDPRLLITAATP